jgi:hypothetical protein
VQPELEDPMSALWTRMIEKLADLTRDWRRGVGL